MADLPTKLSSDLKRDLGIKLGAKRDQYKQDRRPAEEQWMKNLRQYRGVYDPEVLRLIPETRSRAYPRDTRIKVKAFVARMMEMMFPASDKNWELAVTPLPSIAAEDLDAIIRALELRELQMAEAEQRPPRPLLSEDIETAVVAFANLRKDAMEQQIDDQLNDPGVDWPSIVKRVIRSGAIYGIGFAKAPLVRTQTERQWQIDPTTGAYKAATKKLRRPYPEFIKVWDIYPDMSALSWQDQDGLFERLVLSRQALKDLTERPGFDADVIRTYLRDNREGNYKACEYESEISELNRDANPIGQRGTRKYEVYRWFGFWSGHELKDIGVDVPDTKLDVEVLSDIWVIDDKVIFADLAPFGTKVSDVYHAYIYSEDEEAGLTGVGLPEEVRDTQMGRCSAKRALYDNMSATAGPMLEVAVDLLKPNTDYKTIHSFKVFEREGDDETLMHPAVRQIAVNSHIPELMNILKMDQEHIDIESNIPSWTLGATQPLGEAFRTSNNMSMMFGGANMVTKDHTRAFDVFITSVINSFLQWNMEFGPKETQGDFQARGRGNISLVAKEVRGVALDQFVMTLTPEERQMLKTREILLERLKARDLPTDIVVSPEEAETIKGQTAQSQAMAAQATAAREDAQTQKLLADAEKSKAQSQEIVSSLQVNIAKVIAEVESLHTSSKATKDKMQLETIREMLLQTEARLTEGGTPYGPQR